MKKYYLTQQPCDACWQRTLEFDISSVGWIEEPEIAEGESSRVPSQAQR
jgi:deoxycytidylate deaminase